MCPPSTDVGCNHVRVLAHLAQYEEANEAIIARTIFLLSVGIYSLVQLSVVASVMLRILLVFFVYVYSSRSPLGMAASTLGRLPWYYLDTSDTQRAHRILSRPVDISVQTCRRELGTSDLAHV